MHSITEKIKIVGNGFQEEVPSGSSIEFLIRHLNELDPHLIVELNAHIVYPNKYADSIIQEDISVESINYNLGG